MPVTLITLRRWATLLGLLALFSTARVAADGAVGEHVNDLKGHLDEYTEEVNWMIGQIDSMVDAYAQGGAKAAQPEKILDHWEAVKFHSAIETQYIPLYANIWQGLFGVRTAMEEGRPIEAVRAEQQQLEQTLWQSLGAVKVAADYQSRDLLPEVENTQPGTPVETIDVINRRLDRVVAKYAEKLDDEAIEIIQQTYLNLFEGIEGELIALDADLVEDLEIDFNVRAQKAIEDGKSVDEVRTVIESMQGKLDRCRTLLEESEQNRTDVF